MAKTKAQLKTVAVKAVTKSLKIGQQAGDKDVAEQAWARIRGPNAAK